MKSSERGITATWFLHRLVALAFIPNPNNLPQVNHISGDKLNNRVENLEWITSFGNHQHAAKNGLKSRGESRPTSKLTEVDVEWIRHWASIGYSQRRIAKEFGVRHNVIWNVVHRNTWKHVS